MIPRVPPVDRDKLSPRPGRGPDWWLMLRKFVSHGTGDRVLLPVVAVPGPVDGPRDRLGAGEVRGRAGGRDRADHQAAGAARPGPNTKLVIVERDPDFCGLLAAEVPGHDIVEGDACRLDQILADRGIAKADHVISGLPLPSFPPALRDSIIRMAARVLGPDGEFRQITNMPWVYLKLYRQYFRDVSFKLVPLNLPPGGVYFCKGYQMAVA